MLSGHGKVLEPCLTWVGMQQRMKTLAEAWMLHQMVLEPCLTLVEMLLKMRVLC